MEVYIAYLQVFQDNPIAKKVGLEFGFRIALPHRTAVRKPDLAVVLNSNPAGLHLRDRTYSGTFDLCFEALSDSTLRAKQRDTVVKRGEYEYSRRGGKQRAEHAEKRLFLEQEKAELTGEIRMAQRILKRPQNSKEELVQKNIEDLKEMLKQLETELKIEDCRQ